MAQVVGSLFVEDKEHFILHIQQLGCWWAGNAMGKSISNLGIISETQVCIFIPNRSSIHKWYIIFCGYKLSIIMESCTGIQNTDWICEWILPSHLFYDTWIFPCNYGEKSLKKAVVLHWTSAVWHKHIYIINHSANNYLPLFSSLTNYNVPVNMFKLLLYNIYVAIHCNYSIYSFVFDQVAG